MFEFREAQFSSAPWAVKSVSGLSGLHELSHRVTVHILQFRNFITFSTFVKLNHCILV